MYYRTGTGGGCSTGDGLMLYVTHQMAALFCVNQSISQFYSFNVA